MEWLNFHSFKGNYFQELQKTFANYKRVKLIKGKVPEILEDVKTEKIAFISIDMNNAFAEIKCIEYFWNKITKHGVVLLDDYAYMGRNRQFVYLNKLAKKLNFNILTVPSGQGIIIKN